MRLVTDEPSNNEKILTESEEIYKQPKEDDPENEEGKMYFLVQDEGGGVKRKEKQ